MVPSRIVLLGAAFWALTSPAYPQNPPPPPQSQPPVNPVNPVNIVRTIRIVGARELAEADILGAVRVRAEEPLPVTPDEVARRVERRYNEEGYSFARVDAGFDEPTGALTLTIDEGRIDEVEFTGVDERLARMLADDFALRSGDIFNWSRASDALRALLRPSRGALQPGRPGDADPSSRSRRAASGGRGAFDIVERNGRRVLVVGVEERAGMVRLTPDMGEREDWFTPVDGLVPSLGFGGAIFEHTHFNHAYVAGHLSYKMATGRAGYALGFERALGGLFSPYTVYVGGELYDLTATDDTWRTSGTQASLSAFAARESVRDYYRRRGVQLHAAVRASRQIEVFAGWRGERHEPLGVESDFSLWNGDEEFRPNAAAAEGKLNALVLGASVDAVGFDRDSLAATYRRHQIESPFGSPLRPPDERGGGPIWRVEWTTEVSAPGALGGDFAFRRHIVSGRAEVPLSAHEEFRARVIGGWSQGLLPPQRRFAIGGLGSVHGYGFKEATGDRLALVNLEYAIGRLNGLHIAPFFDAGRVATSPSGTSESGVWLNGMGFGLGLGRDFRVDVGYNLDDIPGSVQILLRLGRTF